MAWLWWAAIPLREPLSASVQALGLVEPGSALQRNTAKPGDLLFVSGNPGDAAAGLALEQGAPPAQRFLYPTPRVALGRALRGLASACIDVSDGLAADAGKLALASGCGVHIDADRLPLSSALAAQPEDAAVRLALTGGDDYELCFTVPAARADEIPSRLANVKCAVTCIGVIERISGLRASSRGTPVSFDLRGYDHFSPSG